MATLEVEEPVARAKQTGPVLCNELLLQIFELNSILTLCWPIVHKRSNYEYSRAAVEAGNLDRIKGCVKFGGISNKSDWAPVSRVLYALEKRPFAARDYYSVLEWLLDNGANPNAPNPYETWTMECPNLQTLFALLSSYYWDRDTANAICHMVLLLHSKGAAMPSWSQPSAQQFLLGVKHRSRSQGVFGILMETNCSPQLLRAFLDAFRPTERKSAISFVLDLFLADFHH